ncbi:transposase [Ancylostoma ceylanicum]|uniref:Transposase n=1 Tax=Ancylostoma ceylanicum TaxID=53326 RepID=A0A0D6L8E8_9BILA|nr:transposase [Ancylostoma ceylanicum]
MGDQAPSRAAYFIWYRKFRNGEESLVEAHRIRRPPTQKRSVVIAICEAQLDLSELPKPQSKLKQHDKKELLSFWWDITGPVFWELVQTGSMVDSDLFCSQLEKVARILRSRHPEKEKILLLMDNAPHISKKSSEKLKDLGIPPYSPDLAPSDYHVFRSMQSFFAGKKLKDRAEVK